MYQSQGCKQQPLAAGRRFTFWLKLKILCFVTTICWRFIIYICISICFNLLVSLQQRGYNTWCHPYYASLSHAQLQKQTERTDTNDPSTVLVGHYRRVKVVSVYKAADKLGTQWQAKSPPPTTTSHIAPPVEKCNHIFRKGGSSAQEKRVYLIHTHCHYAVHVVST